MGETEDQNGGKTSKGESQDPQDWEQASDPDGLTAWLFGGPFHKVKISLPAHALQLTFVIGKDDKDQRVMEQMSQVGISPPVGTHLITYRALTVWDDDLLYLFQDEQGGQDVSSTPGDS